VRQAHRLIDYPADSRLLSWPDLLFETTERLALAAQHFGTEKPRGREAGDAWALAQIEIAKACAALAAATKA
jgi:hypothetical protein